MVNVYQLTPYGKLIRYVECQSSARHNALTLANDHAKPLCVRVTSEQRLEWNEYCDGTSHLQLVWIHGLANQLTDGGVHPVLAAQ